MTVTVTEPAPTHIVPAAREGPGALSARLRHAPWTRRWRDFGAAWLVTVALLVSALLVHSDLERQAERSIALAREEVRTDMVRQFLRREFEVVAFNLMVLATGDALRDLLDRPGVDALRTLGREFLVFSERHERYDQIRYLDERGHEVVRVDFNRGAPIITPPARLQNKRERYYFKEGLALGRAQIYVSPLDFNVERGRVETPLKPVIRFVTPIFDEAGTKRGIVVLNYSAVRILDGLKVALGESGGKSMLLDARGEWLVGPGSGRELGFQIGREPAFAVTHRQAWRRIEAAQTGHFESDGATYTFVTLHPLADGWRLAGGVDDPATQGYRWKLVTRLPTGPTAALAWHALRANPGLYGVLLLLACLPSGIYAWAREASRRAEDDRALSRKITEASRQAIVLFDAHRRVVDVNYAFSAITGYTPTEAVGRRVENLADPQAHDAAFFNDVQRRVDEEGHWHGEIHARRRDGTVYVALADLGTVRNTRGELSHYLAIFSDFTERKRAEDRLSELATHDTLTGLLNRNVLRDRLYHAIQRAVRQRSRVAVLFLDLDHFKAVNDRFGHAAGDTVLIEISRRLKRALRESDTVVRLGGDEFVVLLEDLRDRARIVRLAKALLDVITEPVALGDDKAVLGASIGISVFPDHGGDPDNLIKSADESMYEAKMSGRNAYRFHGEQSAA